MPNIVIHLKDGQQLKFTHEGRPGGSYTKRLTFDGAFAIVTDEWGTRTAIPAQDIAMVVETPHQSSEW